MYTLLSSSAFSIIALIGLLFLLLHLGSRMLFLSDIARSKRLFSSALWLPLRENSGVHESSGDMESVDFQTADGLTLRGSYFHHTAERRCGTVLYFHEMNGTRWSFAPYIDQLRKGGFDIFTFDQRGHGTSDSFAKFYQTPWITPFDMDDAQSAIRYLMTRTDSDSKGIGVFGLGKGATLALCAASVEPVVQSVIMDCPAPEERLYEKNCWTVLRKTGPTFATRRFSLFLSLLFKALLYTIACPFFALFAAWRRFILSCWFGGHFVNARALVRRLRKPILILHGELDSGLDLEQIHAFCQQMPIRPKLWLLKGSSIPGAPDPEIAQQLTEQVLSFFSDTLKEVKPVSTVATPTGEQKKKPAHLTHSSVLG
ncbi:MAG: alpha/beta hydrolase [Thermoguttaceae bacterium]